MRADVREATIQAARAELELNDTYVALVSRPLLEALAQDWSKPAQIRAEITRDGLVEFVVQTVSE